jgi:hypothetical protein
MDAEAKEVPVEVVKIESFLRDVELSVRTAVKGGSLAPVSLKELQEWVNRALVATDDDSIAPKALGDSDATLPFLSPKARKSVLTKLKIDLKQKLEKPKLLKDANVRDLILASLVKQAKGQAQVEIKAGNVRAASKDEISQWLTGTAPGKTKD